MSKDKYIIANCPALFNTPDGEFKNDCCDKPGTSPCKDCTDCVLKQIVELCRKAPILDADWVLNKLDIQEVE